MSMRQFQIEEILMNAHQSDVDLIEEYFSSQSSLDEITNQAHELLKYHSTPDVLEVIQRNLSECMIVKSQMERRSMKGLFKKALRKLGISLGQNREILRAELLLAKIKQIKQSS